MTMTIDDYREEAVNFINTAFCALYGLENAPAAYKNRKAYLSDGYDLYVDSNGNLSLIKYDDTEKSTRIIAHSRNRAHSSITYIAKILAVYLEHLQNDE